jgi:DNA-binding NarL/FixJ family response regulator
MAPGTEIVGRDEEMALVQGFFDRADGASRALIVEGHAGIGKSTLWAAAVEHARRRGFGVLAARPAEAERALTWAVLSDLLDDQRDRIECLPERQRQAVAQALLLEPVRGAPLEPRAVAVGLLAVLRGLRRERPLLVAVDDEQWVDAASAAALSFALRRTAGETVALCLSRRAGFGGALQLDSNADVIRLDVGPLSLGALRRLLEHRLGVSFPRPTLRRIHSRSEGNPFYALELARAISVRGGALSPDDELPVPGDIEVLLSARLRALPPPTTDALAAVAALADPVVGSIGEDVLQPAIDAGMVMLDRDRIRFEHPLIAEAAYAQLSPAARRAMHVRLAELVHGFEERARHLALASEGPDPAVAELLEEAARSAQSRGAPDAAAELAALALRLTEPQDGHARALRAAAAAEYRAVAGDPVSARDVVDAALAAAPAPPDRARLLLQRSRLGGASVDETIRLLRDALACVGGEAAVEAEILADLTHAITNARRFVDVEPYAVRSLELAESSGDVRLIVRALEIVAITRFRLGRGLSPELSRRALELDPLCTAMRVSLRPPSAFGWMYAVAGELDMARPLLERARGIGESTGDMTVSSVLWYLSALEFFADDWQRAFDLANELFELGSEAELEQTIMSGLCALAVSRAYQGDEELARRYAGEAFALDERLGSRWAENVAGSGLALLELSLDHFAEALALARRVTVGIRADGLGEPGLLLPLPEHIEAAIAANEQEEAEELIEWAEEHAIRLDRAWALACCARGRGLLAAARGDEAAALAAFAQALAEHDRVQGRRFDRARTLLAHGETLRRFKKKRAARDAIDAALEVFDELGAKLWSAKAKRELARISGRRTAAGLTETERRIAALVADGYSNKEVANELFVTQRTVETHLTNVYAKLGLRSRTELARRLPP